MDCRNRGVICKCRITGCFAFGSKRSPDLETRITRGIYNCTNVHYQRLSDTCKNLIACMLCTDQDRRPSAAGVLQHPWFTGSALTAIAIPTLETNEIGKEVSVNVVSRRRRCE